MPQLQFAVFCNHVMLAADCKFCEIDIAAFLMEDKLLKSKAAVGSLFQILVHKKHSSEVYFCNKN